MNAPQSEGLPSVAEWEHEVKGEAERKTAEDVGRGQRLALTNWAVWMVALAGGFFAMSRYAIIDWGIFFLEVKKGYATETAACIITLNSIVGAVSSGVSGIIPAYAEVFKLKTRFSDSFRVAEMRTLRNFPLVQSALSGQPTRKGGN